MYINNLLTVHVGHVNLIWTVTHKYIPARAQVHPSKINLNWIKLTVNRQNNIKIFGFSGWIWRKVETHPTCTPPSSRLSRGEEVSAGGAAEDSSVGRVRTVSGVSSTFSSHFADFFFARLLPGRWNVIWNLCETCNIMMSKSSPLNYQQPTLNRTCTWRRCWSSARDSRSPGALSSRLPFAGWGSWSDREASCRLDLNLTMPHHSAKPGH